MILPNILTEYFSHRQTGPQGWTLKCERNSSLEEQLELLEWPEEHLGPRPTLDEILVYKEKYEKHMLGYHAIPEDFYLKFDNKTEDYLREMLVDIKEDLDLEEITNNSIIDLKDSNGNNHQLTIKRVRKIISNWKKEKKVS